MIRRLALALAILPLCATVAAAEPADSWMVHVNRDGETGTYSYLVPVPMEAAPGATIELMLFGQAEHSMVSVDGAWPDLVVRSDGSVASATFAAPDAAGDYRFYCKLHATPDTKPGDGLAGVLRVAAPAEDEQATPARAEDADSHDARMPMLGLAAIAAVFTTLALARRPRR